MASEEDFAIRQVAHVRIEMFQQTADYVFPKRKMKSKALREDYAAHAEALIAQLVQALGPLPPSEVDKRLTIEGLKRGTLVEIETRPPNDSTSSPAKVPQGLHFPIEDIVVLKSLRNQLTESAIVFVPDDARSFLSERLANYGRNPGNAARPDLARFEAVERIGKADALSLFTSPLIGAISYPIWWEVWVREHTGRANAIAVAAASAGLEVHQERLIFPDTVVLLFHGSAHDMISFVSRAPGAFVEIRRATDTIEVFLEERGDAALSPADHVADLLGRVSPASSDAPVVCLLDSGVAAAHPLLKLGLAGAWSYDAAWGADDHILQGGHGTALAGLVLYGDLFGAMADERKLQLTHHVESVKYLTPPGFPQPSLPSYGAITQGAVAMAELNGGSRSRTFCIASSTALNPATGPSSWSGALDQLASGSTLADQSDMASSLTTPKRLILVAGGNVQGGQRSQVLATAPIEDPAQSWNALTIGGFTTKDSIYPFQLQLQPLARANDVSPFSRGSNELPGDLTPIKPEVLFEAGNMAIDASDFCGCHPSLSLLATGADVENEPLLPFWATSAAAALAGNFLGRLKAELPDLWPETYRALTVHSADWTGPMRSRLVGRGGRWKGASKRRRQRIVRELGYGVPNLERAISSAKNDMMLLAQAQIQPFAQKDGSAVYSEIHFYDLPWPKTELEALENEIVTMKVTLSYFIEPNLTGRAATRPDTYRSFGLRFAMKKRSHSFDVFKRRYSKALASEKIPTITESDYWLLGPNSIAAGSLHCDLWRGPAAELVGHDAIAVFPVGGWWKSHVSQKRMNEKARYALAISIDARPHHVDLQAEIAQRVSAKEIEVSIG